MIKLRQILIKIAIFILGGIIGFGVFYFLRMQQLEEENINKVRLVSSMVKAELSLAELDKGNCELAIKYKWKPDAIAKAFAADRDTSFSHIDAFQMVTLNAEVMKSFEEFYYVKKMCNAWRKRTIAMIYERPDSISREHALVGYSSDLDLLMKKSVMLVQVIQKHYPNQN